MGRAAVVTRACGEQRCTYGFRPGSQTDSDERAVLHTVDVGHVAGEDAGAVGPATGAGNLEGVVSGGPGSGGEAAAQGVAGPGAGQVSGVGQALDDLGGGLRSHPPGRVPDRAAAPGHRRGEAVPAVNADEQRAFGAPGGGQGGVGRATAFQIA